MFGLVGTLNLLLSVDAGIGNYAPLLAETTLKWSALYSRDQPLKAPEQAKFNSTEVYQMIK